MFMVEEEQKLVHRYNGWANKWKLLNFNTELEREGMHVPYPHLLCPSGTLPSPFSFTFT